MKSSFVIATALTLLLVTHVSAADDVSSAILGSMGLAPLRPISAQEGLAVRGKGTYAGVWGSSTANWGGQTSSNNYSAGASWIGKPSGATGGSFSFAGKAQFFGRFGR